MNKPQPSKIVLGQVEKFDLMALVKAEYMEKAINDPEFAKYAREKLGHAEINEHHVKSCRLAFGFRLRPASVSPSAQQQIDAIELRMKDMETAISDLRAAVAIINKKPMQREL